jgi:hypothetical protein
MNQSVGRAAGRGGGRSGSSSAAPFSVDSPDGRVTWRVGPDQRIEKTIHTSRSLAAEPPMPGAPPRLTPAPPPPATLATMPPLPATVRLLAGSAPSPLVCWIVGSSGLVLRTTDAVRFDVTPVPATVDLVAVRAIDATNATVTTADGRRFTTNDGGRSWREE